MALLPIDDLITPVTADEMLEGFLTALEDVNIPARSWRPGGVARTILRIVAVLYAGFSTLQAFAVKSGFLGTATGLWLRLLAKYLYGVDAIDATFAGGQVTLTNGSGGLYGPFNPRAFRVLNPTTGKAYVNTTTFTLNPGATLTIDVEAVELGASSSSGPGAVTKLDTFLIGVTCTNVSAIIGTDAEDDPTLRQRCLDKLASLSPNGPRGAYAYAIKSAKRLDGSAVDINRWQISPSSSTGVVTIALASPSGPPIAGDIDAVDASIEAIARPDTDRVDLSAATTSPFTRTLTIWAVRTPGVSSTDVSDAVTTALEGLIKTWPIGGLRKPPSTQGYLYAERISAAANNAHPTIYAVDGAGADLLLNAGEVASLSTTILVNLTEVS